MKQTEAEWQTREAERLAWRLIGAIRVHRITGSLSEAQLMLTYIKDLLDDLEKK